MSIQLLVRVLQPLAKTFSAAVDTPAAGDNTPALAGDSPTAVDNPVTSQAMELQRPQNTSMLR